MCNYLLGSKLDITAHVYSQIYLAKGDVLRFTHVRTLICDVIFIDLPVELLEMQTITCLI